MTRKIHLYKKIYATRIKFTKEIYNIVSTT